MKKHRISPVLFVALLLIFIIVVSIQIFRQQRAEIESQSERLNVLETRVALADTRMSDLLRYSRENAVLPPRRDDEIRVVFLGDSITDNWDNEDYGGFFPESKTYINRGIGGETTLEMLARFRQDVVALNPQIVVILAGTNDLGFNIGNSPVHVVSDNLISMSELAQRHNIMVILASVLPVNDYSFSNDGKPLLHTKGRPLEKILELNQRIRQLAESNGLIYLDYHSAMTDEKGMLKTEFTEDGLHPNATGYTVMSNLAEAAIEKVKAKL